MVLLFQLNEDGHQCNELGVIKREFEYMLTMLKSFTRSCMVQKTDHSKSTKKGYRHSFGCYVGSVVPYDLAILCFVPNYVTKHR